jgi:hypothetical protein
MRIAYQDNVRDVEGCIMIQGHGPDRVCICGRLATLPSFQTKTGFRENIP